MDKRRLHHLWTKLRPVRPWYFLALAVVSGIVCVLALRANNLHMVALRDQVYAADKNDGDVKGALQQLQVYVTSHMNTELSTGSTTVYPPIQLKYTYGRLLAAADKKANQSNTEIYRQAQAYCEKQDPVGFSGRYRVPCIQQYIKSHDVTLPTIPDAMYKFDFVSPTWSPDLAGWSMVVAIASALAFVVLFMIKHWLHRRAR